MFLTWDNHRNKGIQMNENQKITLPPSLIKHGLIVMVASAASTVVAALAVTGSISMHEGPMMAWMCIVTFLAFRYAVRVVRAGRVTRDAIVITLASDTLVLWAVFNIGVGRVAITALLIHYILYYYRAYLSKEILSYAK